MTAAGSVGDRHITGFDYLRVVAALGVVWIHGCDTNALARSFQTWTSFAVPCFWLMSAFLTQASCVRKPELGCAGLLVKRLQRLGPAYLAWTAIYLALRFAKSRLISHTAFHVDWVSVVFCGGASYQLYFVPALLVLSVALAPLAVWAPRAGRAKIVGIALAALGAALLWLGPRFSGPVRWPAGYEIFAYLAGQAGYFPLGMGLWWLLMESARRGLPSSGASATLCVCLGAGAVWLATGSAWFGPVYSVTVFCLALLTRLPRARIVTDDLAPCAFGIFLSHAVFVEGFQVLAGRVGLAVHSFGATAGIIIGSFICSAMLCIGLRRCTRTRWLVA